LNRNQIDFTDPFQDSTRSLNSATVKTLRIRISDLQTLLGTQTPKVPSSPSIVDWDKVFADFDSGIEDEVDASLTMKTMVCVGSGHK